MDELAQRIASLSGPGIGLLNMACPTDKIAIFGTPAGTCSDPVTIDKIIADLDGIKTAEEYIGLVDAVAKLARELYLCEYRHGGKPKGRPPREH